jgi:hypothetical protein
MHRTGSTALSPGNPPPTQISTRGEFDSPRGCRWTFGSAGTTEATRTKADFTGTDCRQATFTGRVLLTKGSVRPPRRPGKNEIATGLDRSQRSRLAKPLRDSILKKTHVGSVKNRVVPRRARTAITSDA